MYITIYYSNMFDKNIVKNYLLPMTLILIASSFSKEIKQYFKTSEDVSDYELVRKYLLNDFPLYGKKRPIIWIHSEYEVNARKWNSFQSRNTKELNQPYLTECVQSVINMCGNDFNICLIDDESFDKLIPNWNVDMSSFSDPIKKQYRLLGLMKLIYIYGGIHIPNSFLCTSNLNDLFNPHLDSEKVFACENVNKTVNMMQFKNQPRFIPTTDIIGSVKENPVMLMFIKEIESVFENGHYTSEYDFKGCVSNILYKHMHSDSISVIDGRFIGIKDDQNKPITIDDLMQEDYLNISDAYGIYIPKQELLKRTKYQWFAVASQEQLYETTNILTKFFVVSSYNNANNKQKITPLVTSI